MKNLLFLTFFVSLLITLITSCKNETTTSVKENSDSQPAISNPTERSSDDLNKLEDVLRQLRELLSKESSQKSLMDSKDLMGKNLLMGKAANILANYTYSKNEKNFTEPIHFDTAKIAIRMSMINSPVWKSPAVPLNSEILKYRQLITHHDLITLMPFFQISPQPGINIYPIKIVKNKIYGNSTLIEITNNKTARSTDELYDYGDAGGYKSESKVHPCMVKYNSSPLPTECQ